MSNQLESLLNRCIQLGRKPRGDFRNIELHIDGDSFLYHTSIYSINDLCSIESGFWQFVCEKGLLKDDITKDDYDYRQLTNEMEFLEEYAMIMLSSIQEDKSDFICNNVKLPDDKL